MKIVVDAARCQGHARCFTLSEALFPLDEDGYSALREGGGVELDEREHDLARTAASMCPEQAIRLVEETEGALHD